MKKLWQKWVIKGVNLAIEASFCINLEVNDGLELQLCTFQKYFFGTCKQK